MDAQHKINVSRELEGSREPLKLRPISPAVRERIINHEIEDTWESCCLKVDKRAVQYFTQMGIIAGVMIFAIVQLSDPNTDCGKEATYMGLLTMMIGLIIPSPAIKKKE